MSSQAEHGDPPKLIDDVLFFLYYVSGLSSSLTGGGFWFFQQRFLYDKFEFSGKQLLIKQTSSIKYLFEPRSVAVIGASSDPKKIGHQLLDNILSGNYKGSVFPVNPKRKEILGLKVFPNMDAVNEKVDVALIAVPSPFVFEAVKACADNGVKFLLVISSGFSEVGNIDEEKRIVEYARQRGVRVVGPNIFGFFSARASLNATFGPKDIQKGNVAIVTQSGALGAAMIGKTAVENIGLSAVIAVGNKADLDESDLLEYLVNDDRSKIILFYMEGVHHGEALIKGLMEATKRKPVVVIKSGRSKRGAMAAASHTGSLAGSDKVFHDIMRQVGVLRAESLQEALNWSKFLAASPLPEGRNTVIVTNGGGIGVLATDACEKYNIDLYTNEAVLKDVFSKFTPEFGSTKNPVDLTAQAQPEDYNLALKAALENPNIHSVLSLYCETAGITAQMLVGLIEKNHLKYKARRKPLVFSIFGGEQAELTQQMLRKNSIPVFGEVYESVSCLGALYAHFKHLKSRTEVNEEIRISFEKIDPIIRNALSTKRTFLLPYEAQAVVRTVGIDIPVTRIAKSLHEAVSFAEEVGYPVVMKIVSKDIIHKKDIGGVFLDLENREEIIDAYQTILHNCREHMPHAVIEGVEIAEMVKTGTEVIVGARRDMSFGPIVMFGLGGSYVEVLNEVAFRAFPVDDREIMHMIKETKAYPLLLGVRGEKEKDISCVVDSIKKVGAFIQQCPSIMDIEINPLTVYDQGHGIKAVDVRILLSSTEGGRENG